MAAAAQRFENGCSVSPGSTAAQQPTTSTRIEAEFSPDPITAADYRAALKLVTGDRFKSLAAVRQAQFESTLKPWKCINKDRFDFYGVVWQINDDEDPRQTSNKRREVELVDPTVTGRPEDGLLVKVKLKAWALNIPTRAIVRLVNVRFEDNNEMRMRRLVADDDCVGLIYTFSYDYTKKERFEIHFKTDHTTDEMDEKMAYILERWLAVDLLTVTGKTLSQMPDPGPRSDPRSYFDFVGRVVASQKMRLSVGLTVWDGTEPRLKTLNPFHHEYCDDNSPPNTYHRFNDEMLFFDKINDRFAYISVFRNESDQKSDFYHIAKNLPLNNGHDLLAFFNCHCQKAVEDGDEHKPKTMLLSRTVYDPIFHGESAKDYCKLMLHSGRSHGKGVRIVRRGSVLGRMFCQRAKIPTFDRIARYFDERRDQVEKEVAEKELAKKRQQQVENGDGCDDGDVVMKSPKLDDV